MGGLLLFGGLASGLALVVPVSLVLGFLVILALRHDDDADGLRAPAIYGALVAFVGLLVVLLAVVTLVSGLVELSDEFNDDDATRSGLVLSAIIAVVGMALLVVHRRLFRLLEGAGGAAARVRRAYLLVFCFVAAVLTMVAGGMTLYGVYGLLDPETIGAFDRGDVVRDIVPALVLALGAGLLWREHWRRLDLWPAAPAVTPADAP